MKCSPQICPIPALPQQSLLPSFLPHIALKHLIYARYCWRQGIQEWVNNPQSYPKSWLNTHHLSRAVIFTLLGPLPIAIKCTFTSQSNTHTTKTKVYETILTLTSKEMYSIFSFLFFSSFLFYPILFYFFTVFYSIFYPFLLCSTLNSNQQLFNWPHDPLMDYTSQLGKWWPRSLNTCSKMLLRQIQGGQPLETSLRH